MWRFSSVTVINGQGNPILRRVPENRQPYIGSKIEYGAHTNIWQINGDDAVVIDFFADWCPPCKAISPVFEGLAGENTSVGFYKVNVDNQEQIAKEVGIRAVSGE